MLEAFLQSGLGEEELGFELDEEAVARLRDDFQELDADVNELFIPEPGAYLSFSVFTDTGFEGWRYDWRENLALDSSQPLSILRNVGDDPVAFSAWRVRHRPELYELVRKFAPRLRWYAESLALTDAESRAQYEQDVVPLYPLLERLDRIVAEQLLPALDDGQRAVVFDLAPGLLPEAFGWPPAIEPLPMPQLGLVIGVSDAPRFRRGIEEGIAVVEQVRQHLEEIAPEETASISQFSPHETREIAGGTMHVWHLGPGPNVTLTDSLLLISSSLQQPERLLEENDPQWGGVLSDWDRPLAAASRLNFARAVDAVEDWTDYIFEIGFFGLMGLDLFEEEEMEFEFELEAFDEAGRLPGAEPSRLELHQQPVPSARSAGFHPMLGPGDGPTDFAPGRRYGVQSIGASPDFVGQLEESPDNDLTPFEFPPFEQLPDGELEDPEFDHEMPGEIEWHEIDWQEHTRAFFNLLRAYRGFTSITWQEDDALLTRWQHHFEDLP